MGVIQRNGQSRNRLLSEENFIDLKKETTETKAMMVLGFKILLVMVATMVVITAGLVFAYWQFTYLEDKDSNIHILKVENQLSDFKNCMKYSPTYYTCVK